MKLKMQPKGRIPELIFHPDVVNDVKSAFNWYQSKTEGLGDDFIAELESAYIKIIQHSDTWPKFHDQFQRFLLKRFPFAVIFKFKKATVLILTSMRTKRKPDFWKNRI